MFVKIFYHGKVLRFQNVLGEGGQLTHDELFDEDQDSSDDALLTVRPSNKNNSSESILPFVVKESTSDDSADKECTVTVLLYTEIQFFFRFSVTCF